MTIRILIAVAGVAVGCATPDQHLDAGETPDAGLLDPGDPADAGTGGPQRWTLTVFEPPDGDTLLVPLGIGEDGAVYGHAGADPWDPQARPVRLVAGTTQVLPTDERNFGFAYGGNAHGVAVGEWHWLPQKWSGGVRTTLAVPEGWGSGSARDVNDAGVIVGSYRDYDDSLGSTPGPRPCAWRADGRHVVLATPEGEDDLGTAWAIHANGRIAGTVQSGGGAVAARWESLDAAPTLVGLLDGAAGGEGRAINAHGDVAGRSTVGTRLVATLFPHDGAPVALPDPVENGGSSEAFGIDDAGRVVGLARVADGVTHAILWEDAHAVDLNERLVGVGADVDHLSAANGIDAAGRIAVTVKLVRDGKIVTTAGVLQPAP